MNKATKFHVSQARNSVGNIVQNEYMYRNVRFVVNPSLRNKTGAYKTKLLVETKNGISVSICASDRRSFLSEIDNLLDK